MATAVDQEQSLKALKNKRRSIKSALTRALTFVTNFDPRENAISLLEFRQEELPSLNRAFDDIQSQIELADPNNVEEADAEREAFEQKYFMVRSQMQEVIKLEKSQNTSLHNCSSNSVIPTQRARLAPIALPQFDGNILEWEPFFDLYRSLVHEDDSLPSSQKFSHLRSCLSGQALDIIKALPLTENNYNVAINRLKKRYDNKSLVIQSHIRNILDVPGVKGTALDELQTLHSCITTHVNALEALGQPIEYWDAWLVTIILSKLDQATVQEWQLTRKDTEFPRYTDLEGFLINRCVALESCSAWIFTSNEAKDKLSKSFNSTRKNKSNATVLSIQPDKCVVCSESHMIYHCPKFKEMQVCERYNTVKQNRLCFNCLSPNHGSRDCKAQSCRHCKYKHNSLLHGLPYQSKKSSSLNVTIVEKNPDTHNISELTQNNTSTSNVSEENNSIVSTLHNSCTSKQVLLSTAAIMVQDNYGKWRSCRAILDNGSQINILSQRMAQQLGVDRRRSSLPINGVNGATTNSTEWCKLHISSRNFKFSSSIDCHILPRLTAKLPIESFDISAWKWPTDINCELADPNFNTSADVDLLLGAEIFCEILRDQKYSLAESLWLYNTTLGWVISGVLQSKQCMLTAYTPYTCFLSISSWMSSTKRPITKRDEELACERCFVETHTRAPDGRFIVRLPFREEPLLLGGSMEMALKRFIALEKRLEHNEKLSNDYKKFMREYEELGHMSHIADPITMPGQYYYIPHHAVLKESSATTKLRVVFDASMKTTSNYSLNDLLMVGPVVQSDLVDILIRFRLYNIVLTADVSKMYRQILMDKSDRSFQRILWRDSPEKAITHYNLNTVTYGMTPSSYLATRVLQEISNQCRLSSSQASRAIKEDFYVDDFVSGADNIYNAKLLYRDVSSALKGGGMLLRKWCSNSAELCKLFSDTSSEEHYSLELSAGTTITSLGLTWCPKSDELIFLNKHCISRQSSTKRELLSTLNSVFDPLGFLGPVLIRGKVFLQELWQLELGWDDKLPIHIQNRWRSFVEDLDKFEKLKIPRQARLSNQGLIQLHGFCDASQIAFGACIYLRQQININKWNVRLLCAKSRVAPTKTTTIPRLELAGALLLAELMLRVSKTTGISLDNSICWCDSTVVLSWIRGTPAQWKTYVGNRVTQIIDAVGVEHWRHIGTNLNPADPLSRGVHTNTLINLHIWWSGPEYLQDDESLWPTFAEIDPSPDILRSEQRPIKFTLTVTTDCISLLDIFSTWNKLLRISAIWMRFINWLRHRHCLNTSKTINGPLQVNELEYAQKSWVRYAQFQCFSEEIKKLSNGSIITKGPLKHLSPFMDDDGILRVGGRLEHSKELYFHKHPAVLPYKHRVTKLIFEANHLRLLHMGPQGLLSNIRLQFWPLRGRDLARQTVNNCQRCFRAKPIPLQPPMGQLPSARVSANRPFTQTGVDFAGPLNIRVGLRKGTLMKAYVAVFVCLSTKAVHLEPVSDLSSDAFMACLRRFISRRGLPSHIWSDNATNFVGAQRELRRYFSAQRNGRTISEDLICEGIQWVFIPPASPHFGGLWEASVKSFKHHFVRSVAGVHLNFEQLCTILSQIEACLNSRPLTALSSDPSDFQALTPNHFLIGGPSRPLPNENLLDIPSNRLRKWMLIQKLYQGLWCRWRKEYLSSLQGKAKWFQNSAPIKIGSLAVLKEDNTPPLSWQMVRIRETYPGKDGIIRVASVQTPNGNILKRPVVKLCPLPEDIGTD